MELVEHIITSRERFNLLECEPTPHDIYVTLHGQAIDPNPPWPGAPPKRTLDVLPVEVFGVGNGIKEVACGYLDAEVGPWHIWFPAGTTRVWLRPAFPAPGFIVRLGLGAVTDPEEKAVRHTAIVAVDEAHLAHLRNLPEHGAGSRDNMLVLLGLI